MFPSLMALVAVLCLALRDVDVRVENQGPCAVRVQVLEAGTRDVGRVEVAPLSRASLRIQLTPKTAAVFMVHPGAGCNEQRKWEVPNYVAPEASRIEVVIGTFQHTSSVRARYR